MEETFLIFEIVVHKKWPAACEAHGLRRPVLQRTRAVWELLLYSGTQSRSGVKNLYRYRFLIKKNISRIPNFGLPTRDYINVILIPCSILKYKRR